MEYVYVTGLSGVLTTSTEFEVNNQTYVAMSAGDRFVLRWDYAPEKGIHLNAEYWGRSRVTKIAFTPSFTPIVDPPENRKNVQYQQIVGDQSAYLEYDTRPNTLAEVFRPEQRTNAVFQLGKDGKPIKQGQDWRVGNDSETLQKQQDALIQMAGRLRERWCRLFDGVTRVKPVHDAKTPAEHLEPRY